MSSVNALKDEFVRLLTNHNYQPVSDKRLKEYFKEKYRDLVVIINELTVEGRLKLFHQDSALSYALVREEEAEKLRGLNSEQKLVLQEIEKSGNMGIWTRDIKLRTSLQQQIITKILRVLETRRLVKSVKAVGNKNKKLYMLYDTVPSIEITGGPWYNEQEFDHVFIDALCKFIYEYVKFCRMATLKQITEKVQESGISKVALGVNEIMSIVNILIYDRKLEQVRDPRMDRLGDVNYKISSIISTYNYLTETPCGVCPVFDVCTEGGVISPDHCIYLTKWFEQPDLEF